MEELLAKYFTSEATAEETAEIEIWRAKSQENAQLFQEYKETWLIHQKIEHPGQFFHDEMLSEKTVASSRQLWIRYAAAAVILLSLGLWYVFSLNESEDPATLSDGSVVELHQDATVDIVSFTDEKREVKVTGKAYFDIQRDENRPFIIHLNGSRVKVLGTSFMVESYPKESQVCVESGTVEFVKVMEDSEIKVEVVEGEMAVTKMTESGIIKKENDNPNYLAWKTRVIVFEDSGLSEVAQILEDVYNVKVELENQNLSTCRLTAKFNNKEIEDTIEIIARTFNLKFEISGQTVLLKGNGC
jgi:ferric-dicitrate binding protein FerR (iron transport regulator)